MSDWVLEYDNWAPKQEKLRETLCTLGNGYFATRGAREESAQGLDRYAGTYLGGGLNRTETLIAGKILENEDLVNWPDWTPLTFRMKGGNWFSLENVEVLKFHQQLDIKGGILKRSICFRSEGLETQIETKRFVSMANPHLAGICWNITPLNWEGEIEIKSMIDGSVTNAGVERYKELNGKHLILEKSGLASEDAIYLLSKTGQSQIMMALVARTRAYERKVLLPLERETFIDGEVVGQLLKFNCRCHKTICVEKIVTIYSSHDFAIAHPLEAAKKLNHRLGGFEKLLCEHQLKWKFLWQRFNITLKEMKHESRTLRLHIFHLLQTVSHHSIGRDISVPSRGLHGEAYRGHIFWDEMFIFPFIYFRTPELARSLLLYRYRRLNEAKFMAQEGGLQGAMYPWQSGSDGREETQQMHLNPDSGNWIPDNTNRQRHINGAIVYNIDKYFQATCDRAFLSHYGAEMVLEIAKFWVSMTQFDPSKKRFVINGVVGPDEFHTKYPESDHLGLNNNAYTNYLASWSIRKALSILDFLPESRREELLVNAVISPIDLEHWKNVSHNIYIPFHDDGIISQFEGFENLTDFDWESYRDKYNNLQRLDRILEAEGISINDYKVNKQGDVLMLFYLFNAEEIADGFDWLGYDFRPELIPKNIQYYLGHSSSGSSLTRIVHAWVLARSDRRNSWRIFQEALESDVSDIQGGTTGEGIHLGAMSGSVDIVQRCFTGMEVVNGIIWFNPQLPEELKGIELALRFRGHWLSVNLDHEHLQIKVDHSWEPEGSLGFRGKVYQFKEGSFFNFNLRDDSIHQGLM